MGTKQLNEWKAIVEIALRRGQIRQAPVKDTTKYAKRYTSEERRKRARAKTMRIWRQNNLEKYRTAVRLSMRRYRQKLRLLRETSTVSE